MELASTEVGRTNVEDGPGAGLRVLVVDDDAVARKVIAVTCRRLGFEVVEADDGPPAVAMAERGEFDLALVDYELPTVSGLEVLHGIHRHLPDAPVVMVTASTQTDRIVSTMREGALDFVVKPPATAALQDSLDRAVRQVERERRVVDSERRRVAAEEALRDSEQRLRALIWSSQDAMIALGPEGGIALFNPAAARMFGRPEADTLGRGLAQLLPPDQADAYRERIAGFLTAEGTAAGEGQTFELTALRADGRKFQAELSVSAAGEADSRLVLITARDLTERQALERSLAQSEKLQSIGRLAAGIAHEINTPTQYVGDNIHFLQQSFADLQELLNAHEELLAAAEAAGLGEAVARVRQAAVIADVEFLREEIPVAIRQSIEGVERVARIVLAMKEFSHPGGDEQVPTDLNRALDSTLTVARNEWKYVAEAGTDFDPRLPLVPCQPGQLNQVFLNIVINAAHAIAGVVGDGADAKGRITITTRRDGDWAEIRIADTGTGIPAEVLPRIFDPFFTTKEVGKGTGQGLAIAHHVVVEQHHGSIDVTTEPGQGTTFILRLPLAAGEPAGDQVMIG